MLKTILALPPRRARAALLAFVLAPAAQATDVALCTDLGRVTVELFDDRSPQHVTAFLQYVDRGFYSGTVFHRVVENFVVQGGGFDRELRGKPAGSPIENESRNGLRNERGTLAAARTADPHSATSQFYINLANNSALDASGNDFGYTVFGRVTDGMDVIDEIGDLPTGAQGPFASDVPEPLVGITSIARIDQQRLDSLPAEEEREAAIRARIDAASAAADHGEAMEWLDQYRAICGDMDPDLLLTEAATAMAIQRTARAAGALEEYFGVAEETHAGYEQALALYREVVPNSVESEMAGAAVTIARVAGHCASPTAPSIPDGSTATMEEMVQAQTAVRSFMETGDGYLECLNTVLEEDELSDEERALLLLEHNSIVGQMEEVAEQFNEQVRVIRSRQ